MYFYCYNDGKCNCGNHVGDWEVTIVRLHVLGSIGPPTVTLTAIDYERHGDPHYCEAPTSGAPDAPLVCDETGYAPSFRDGTHVVLYAARGGHGLYASAGTSPNDQPGLRALSAVCDTTEYHNGSEAVWNTASNLDVKLITAQKNEVSTWSWFSYPGHWGNWERGCALADLCSVPGRRGCTLESGPRPLTEHGDGCLCTPGVPQMCKFG